MALNQHERDVINALILRVNDLQYEVATLQVAGKRWFNAIPTQWLRNKMGWNKWPSPARYKELTLFVDTAPIVKMKKGEPNDEPGNRTDIPGYYRGRRRAETDNGDDFEIDTGT